MIESWRNLVCTQGKREMIRGDVKRGKKGSDELAVTAESILRQQKLSISMSVDVDARWNVDSRVGAAVGRSQCRLVRSHQRVVALDTNSHQTRVGHFATLARLCRLVSRVSGRERFNQLSHAFELELLGRRHCSTRGNFDRFQPLLDLLAAALLEARQAFQPGNIERRSFTTYQITFRARRSTRRNRRRD